MIEGFDCPVEIKLQILPLFQHMHHDAQTAGMVRELCLRFLPSYPAYSLVVITLHTLTKLAAATLVEIPEQVQLLITYLRTDPRRMVKIKVLKDLQFLALQGPHIWSEDNIQEVLDFALNTSYPVIQTGSVSVLSCLIKGGAATKFDLSEESDTVKLCIQCSYSSNISLAVISS